jgi:NAD(P) transhydrogenase subunit beta
MQAFQVLIGLAYLVAAAFFITGIKWMNSPVSARKGNQLSAWGMAIAVLATFFVKQLWPENAAAEHIEFPDAVRWGVVFGGLFIGSAVGWFMAKTVKMTDMPQAVAIFNGLGGGAAAAVSIATFINIAQATANHWNLEAESPWSLILGTIIGSVTFSGSMIAFGKLQGLISGKPIVLPGQRLWQILTSVGPILLGIYVFILGANDASMPFFLIAFVLALLFGILLVLPIGGADMPVVISLLNSFTGTAASLTGFVLNNYVLIIAGALVGASGFILTGLMCKAMNRSLMNVIVGQFGGAAGAGEKVEGSITETSAEDVAMMLAYANNVIVVPGYGLAVAQAQHAVQEMADLLEKRGVSVKYAIHPVAGRMPGHMNVLLAEANVPYELLYDMEDINPEFEKADVALVIGANDVTNPSARTDASSPIFGMPILDVDKAKNIVVMKRSMAPGYAGIDNVLYLNPKCRMLFGDAKKSVTSLVGEIKNA